MVDDSDVRLRAERVCHCRAPLIRLISRTEHVFQREGFDTMRWCDTKGFISIELFFMRVEIHAFQHIPLSFEFSSYPKNSFWTHPIPPKTPTFGPRFHTVCPSLYALECTNDTILADKKLTINWIVEISKMHNSIIFCLDKLTKINHFKLQHHNIINAQYERYIFILRF